MDGELDLVPFTECIRNVNEKRRIIVEIHRHRSHLRRKNEDGYQNEEHTFKVFLAFHKNIERNVFLVAPVKATILSYSTTPTNAGWLQLHSEDKEIHKTVILHIITVLQGDGKAQPSILV